MFYRICLVIVFAVLQIGCARNAVIQAAEEGRFVELRRALLEKIRHGDLDGDDVRAVARAVAWGEIHRASKSVGVQRLMELRTCARRFEDVLEDRASGSDIIAPAAAMLLLDSGIADMADIREHAAQMQKASSANVATAFTAVYARTLVMEGDGIERRKRILDGDQDVRVAALRAAISAIDPSDREAVLEAARLDPYPLARTLAIRAAGSLGNEVVVLALKDIWVSADEPGREAIADAWANPNAVNKGGLNQLQWAIGTQRGAPAIAAARAIIMMKADDGPDALGVLVRTIAEGPTRDRIYAIHVAPSSHPLVHAALLKAKNDEDSSVALASLTHLLETPSQRSQAISRLLKFAVGNSTQAILAKSALARSNVRQVIPMLLRDTQSKDSRLRQAVGIALIDLDALIQAAPLLADNEPQIRTSVACAILTHPQQ